MCQHIIVHHNNGKIVECETQFDLIREMPNGLDTWDDPFIGNSCLCVVDSQCTAILNGYICTSYDENNIYDPFNKHYYPIL